MPLTTKKICLEVMKRGKWTPGLCNTCRHLPGYCGNFSRVKDLEDKFRKDAEEEQMDLMAMIPNETIDG